MVASASVVSPSTAPEDAAIGAEELIGAAWTLWRFWANGPIDGMRVAGQRIVRSYDYWRLRKFGAMIGERVTETMHVAALL